VARYALYAFFLILYLIITPQINLALEEIQKFVVEQIGQERLSAYFDAKSQSNYIFMHIVFQDPQDWMRHLQECVPRGKILVITLVFTAGVVAIAATMLTKSPKDKKSQADVSRIQLRSYLIQAGMAGGPALKKDLFKAILIALQAYAKQRGVDWNGNLPKIDDSPVSLRIGPDIVTVTTPYQGDRDLMEIRAICGSEGAKVVVGPTGVMETTIFDTRREVEKGGAVI